MRKNTEKLKACLKSHGLILTRQREIILDSLCGAQAHISVKELYLFLRSRYPNIGYVTVYRNLNLFAECGIAQKHNFAGKEDRFELRSVDEEHDHFICRRCGSIVEFQDQRIKELWAQIARENSFTVERHTFELHGVCAGCSL